MIKNINDLKLWRYEVDGKSRSIQVNGYTVASYYSGLALYKGAGCNADALIATFIGFYEEEMYAALAAILHIPNT